MASSLLIEDWETTEVKNRLSKPKSGRDVKAN
jgi:hypothetical protein